MGYVIVEFPDCREVLVNAVSQGNNRGADGEYRILCVGDGWQTFALGGPKDYTPESCTVEVADTSPIQPLRVPFSRKV